MSYEPKIVGFLCNWCSYTGADLAGHKPDPVSSEHPHHSCHVLGAHRSDLCH